MNQTAKEKNKSTYGCVDPCRPRAVTLLDHGVAAFEPPVAVPPVGPPDTSFRSASCSEGQVCKHEEVAE